MSGSRIEITTVGAGDADWGESQRQTGEPTQRRRAAPGHRPPQGGMRLFRRPQTARKLRDVSRHGALRLGGALFGALQLRQDDLQPGVPRFAERFEFGDAALAERKLLLGRLRPSLDAAPPADRGGPAADG
jgi:hypothetical protein